MSDPNELWSMAAPYSLGAVESRQSDWELAAATTQLDLAFVERARAAVAAAGPLRLLAVSEDGCIDSAHSIPHLQALADAVDGLELGLVDSSTGRALMAAHPTPDGRGATPTVVVLDEAGALRGCWVERAAVLQSWYLANPDDQSATAHYDAKTAWYAADGGWHLLDEFVGILESGARGAPVCGVPLDPEPLLPPPGPPAGDAGASPFADSVSEGLTPIALTGDDPDLEALWRSAIPFAEYLAGVRAQARLWQSNHEGAAPDPALVARAREATAGRSWRLLVVSVDGCSDSVNTVPYAAALAEQVEGLEVRVIGLDLGMPLMEARRTPDGRTATPTLVLLDDNGNDAGCFIERPTPLQDWWLSQPAERPLNEKFREKMAWYDDDAGASTIAELVGILEAAAAGRRVCGTTTGSGGAGAQGATAWNSSTSRSFSTVRASDHSL